MIKNLGLVVLIAFLLIEHSQGGNFRRTKDLSTFSDSRKTFQVALKAKLLVLSEEPLKLGIQLIQDTYDDHLVNNNVKPFLNNILRTYRNIETDQVKITLFLMLNALFDVSSPSSNEEPNNESFSFVMQGALEKHNVQGVAIEFQKSFDEFLEWLIPEIDEHSHKFTSEEQLEVIEFKRLCTQYKATTSIEERRSLTKSLVAYVQK